MTLPGDPPPAVVAGDSPATAARKVMWTHVARLLERDLLVRDPERIDDVRKYRVAIRRLRSALRIFASDLRGGPGERLGRDLGELADAVGAVRDADVRIESATSWAAASEAGADALAPLLDAWRTERAKAHARLVRELGGKRHRRLLERLVAFVTEPAAPPSDPGERPAATVRDRAASRIWAAYEPIRAREDRVRSADLESLHRLRIETKRLRYLLEFLADVLGAESGELVAHLTALQDHLGAINDVAVGIAAIRAFIDRRTASLAPAEMAPIGAYLADRERELVGLRVAIGSAWRPVVALSFARRLGRVVVIA